MAAFSLVVLPDGSIASVDSSASAVLPGVFSLGVPEMSVLMPESGYPVLSAPSSSIFGGYTTVDSRSDERERELLRRERELLERERALQGSSSGFGQLVSDLSVGSDFMRYILPKGVNVEQEKARDGNRLYAKITVDGITHTVKVSQSPTIGTHKLGKHKIKISYSSDPQFIYDLQLIKGSSQPQFIIFS